MYYNILTCLSVKNRLSVHTVHSCSTDIHILSKRSIWTSVSSSHTSLLWLASSHRPEQAPPNLLQDPAAMLVTSQSHGHPEGSFQSTAFHWLFDKMHCNPPNHSGIHHSLQTEIFNLSGRYTWILNQSIQYSPGATRPLFEDITDGTI